MNILDDAIRLAVLAFHGELDKAGRPAVLHALQVMFAAEAEFKRNPIPGVTLEEFMTAAVLHDVSEDFPSDYPLSYIQERFGSVVHRMVDGVTRRRDTRDIDGKLLTKGETYVEFIVRAWEDLGSRTLKLVDVHINLGRIHSLPNEERGIQRRYEKAVKLLNAKTMEEIQTLIKSHTRPHRSVPMSNLEGRIL